MWTLIESILFVLLIGNGATDSSSSCRSKDLDSSICNELIKITGSEPLDRSVHHFTSALNSATHNILQTDIDDFGRLFSSTTTNTTTYESFSKSFFLIIFNPGGRASRNVSLTEVLNDCNVLALEKSPAKLLWSGYSNDCDGNDPSQLSDIDLNFDCPLNLNIDLGLTKSQLQQYADASDATIMVVDWGASGLSCYGYYQLVFCLIDKIASLFAHWLSQCVNIETLDLIGVSFGAQMLGYIAQHLKFRGHIPNRLIGLDPANPGFGPNHRCQGVQDRTAQYVAVYHVNPGHKGTPILNIGNASFLINSQCQYCQPDCDCNDTSCLHAYIVQLFQKLTQNDTILATRAESPTKCPGVDPVDLTIYGEMANGYYCVDTYGSEKCPL